MLEELTQAAKAAYAKHGITDAARTVVRNMINKDPELIKAAVTALVEDVLQGAVQQHRRELTRQAVGPPKEYTREFQEAVQKSTPCMLLWPMMDGSPIRLATRAHLLDDAARYEQNAYGNLRSARFARLVAAKVPEGSVVGDTLSETQLAKLMARAAKIEERVAG
jgi:hypothetical protein